MPAAATVWGGTTALKACARVIESAASEGAASGGATSKGVASGGAASEGAASGAEAALIADATGLESSIAPAEGLLVAATAALRLCR